MESAAIQLLFELEEARRLELGENIPAGVCLVCGGPVWQWEIKYGWAEYDGSYTCPYCLCVKKRG